MKRFRPLVHVCFALWLAACSGGDLAVSGPGGTSDETLRLVFAPGSTVDHRLPIRISGGVPPYEASISGCPDWVRLLPDQGILAGIAPAHDHGRAFFCTYAVTDSATFTQPQTRSFVLHLEVASLGALNLASAPRQALDVGVYHSVQLPSASGGVPPYTYAFTCVGGALPAGMGFAPATRMLAGTPDAQFHDSCT